MNLRPYQEQDLKTIAAKVAAGTKDQLIRQATGLGKTVMMANIPKIFSNHKKILILLHTQELARQTVDKLITWNPSLKVQIEMGSNVSDYDCDVVVAGVATLGRANTSRLSKFNPKEYSHILVDEAHHSTADTYTRVINHFKRGNPDVILLGFTATPNRNDGVGLYKIYKEITINRDIRWGVDNKYLKPLRGYHVTPKVNFENIGWQAGDFIERDMASELDTPENNQMFVDAYKKYGEGRNVVYFATTVEHAKNLAATFARNGIVAPAVWGEDEDRVVKIANFERGKTKGLGNVKILTEGWDYADVGCIMLCRFVGSEGLYTQIVGRGTRLSKIYNDCIIIDCAGSSNKHSLCSLPNLFGLHKNLKLYGKSVTEVLEEVEEKLKDKPHIATEEVEDFTKLDTYVNSIDLMRPPIPPEVLQISKYRWRRSGDNHYSLFLIKDECVHVQRNELGSWYIHGNVCGNNISTNEETLEEAIQVADQYVKTFGGIQYNALANATAAWTKKPPSDAQIAQCKRLKIQIPPGATRGEVSNLISATINKGMNAVKNILGS